MSKVIRIDSPAIVCGRLLERIAVLQRYTSTRQKEGNSSFDLDVVLLHTHALRDLACQLQTSLVEQDKARQRMVLEDQLEKSLDAIACEKVGGA